ALPAACNSRISRERDKPWRGKHMTKTMYKRLEALEKGIEFDRDEFVAECLARALSLEEIGMVEAALEKGIPESYVPDLERRFNQAGVELYHQRLQRFASAWSQRENLRNALIAFIPKERETSSTDTAAPADAKGTALEKPRHTED